MPADKGYPTNWATAASSRLRSGAWLEYYDLVSGPLKLDVDSILAGVPFDATTQIIDDSSGSNGGGTLEVDTNTLAARMVAFPDDVNNVSNGWSVGRFCYSSADDGIGSTNLTTTAVTDGCILSIANRFAGLLVIKKINAGLSVGATAGTRAGTTNIKATIFSQYITNPAGFQFPAANRGNLFNAVTGNLGLKYRQHPAQSLVQVFSGNATAAPGKQEANPIGMVEGSVTSTAGADTGVQNVTLWDWENYNRMPLILPTGLGVNITVTLPASATSQTFQAFAQVYWDEWIPFDLVGTFR